MYGGNGPRQGRAGIGHGKARAWRHGLRGGQNIRHHNLVNLRRAKQRRGPAGEQPMRRRRTYCGTRPPPELAGRTAIITDDGIATGATMLAALRAVRRQKPARLVLAVPLASPEALARLRGAADEIICLHKPVPFVSIGQFYRYFPQLSDAEVIALLG